MPTRTERVDPLQKDPRSPSVAPPHIPGSFTATTIQQALGGCMQRVLAFRSLFASFDGKRPGDFPAPGRAWLDGVAMPALLKPQAKLRDLADEIVRSLRGDDDRGHPGDSTQGASETPSFGAAALSPPRAKFISLASPLALFVHVKD